MSKIKEFKFVNCQSWKSARVLRFSEGLNIIRATNSTGKSVIFKALRLLLVPYLFDSEDREQFISYGEEYAEFSVLFDSDEIVIMRVFIKQIIYFYAKDIHNPKFEKTVDMPPDEVVKAMNAIIEPQTGYIMNIVDSDRELFLVDSKNETNVNSLKYITEHQGINHLKEYVETRIPLFEQAQHDVYDKKLDWSDQLYKLGNTNVIQLEKDVHDSEMLVEVFDAVAESYEILDSIQIPDHDMTEYEGALDKINIVIDLLSSGIMDINIGNKDEITDLDVSLSDLAVNLMSTGILNETIEEHHIIEDRHIDEVNLAMTLKEFCETITFEKQPLANVDICLEYLDTLDIVMGVYNTTNYIKRYCTGLENSLSMLRRLELVESCILEFKELGDAVNELIVASDKHNKSLMKIDKYEKAIDELRDDNEVLKCPIYGEIVNKNGICIPVAKSSSTIEIVGGIA